MNTLRGLCGQTVLPREVIVVDMANGLENIGEFPFELRIITMDGIWRYMPLAAARNLGAEISRTEVLIFLDVDCIPAVDFCEAMANNCVDKNALVMGTPKYMLSSITANPKIVQFKKNSIFHPSRPVVEGLRKENCYELFWSLCFSIPLHQFLHIGGFDDGYEGYGAEDTDFALETKKAGVPFFLSDAEVYHQQHPVYVPPLNHLGPIVKNCNLFYLKWHYWPMVDCLEDFEKMGYIDWNREMSRPIRILKNPTVCEVKARLIKNAPYR